MIPSSAVVDVVARSPWTAIVLSAGGEIAEVVEFSTPPTAQTLSEFARTHARGRRFRLVQQARLDPSELEALLAETASAIDVRPAAPPGQLLETWEPRLHPARPLRAVVDAIAGWVAARIR